MRWVSWAAVSSLPQAKKISIDDQLAENRRHVEQHGGQVVAELVVPGESRSIVLFEDACRRIEAYEKLRKLIDARAFDVLVYLDRSRLGRKASLSMSVVELCHDAGIACYETENPPASIKPTDSHDDALIGAIKSVGAQREIDKLRRRHEMGMADRVRRGQFPTTPPFGYVWRYHADGSRTVEIDESAAAIVRQVVTLYLDGHGTPMVAEKMNEAGIAAPQGGQWEKSSVYGLLRRIWTYAGHSELNRRSRKREYIRAPGQHPAIIDEATAHQVDAERAARMANRKISDTIYHLSSVVYCVECGRIMHCTPTYSVSNSGQRYEYVTLRCRRHDPAQYCSYALALRQLRRAILAIDTLDIDALLIDDNDLSELLLGQIAEQETRIEKIRAALQRADDVFFDGGAMDDERYRRQVDRLMSQMSTAQAEIDKLRTRHANEADTAARRQRIESVSSEGIAKLDGDPTTGNAWLRRHVRMWAQDGRIVSVEWL